MSDEVHIPPSQQSAQGPVPKPGEPVKPKKGILAEISTTTPKPEDTQRNKSGAA